MKLKIYEDSTNYTCQVVKLPAKRPVKNLDNLVEVVVQGNSCLIGKDSPENELYLFFPAECLISEEFLKVNNLFRHSFMNDDTSKTGFFEDSGRVKALKFKGVISSGFLIPVESLSYLKIEYQGLVANDEFNMIDGVHICRKYIKCVRTNGIPGVRKTRVIDQIVDSRLAPEHTDTAHLMRNLHKIDKNSRIIITYKLHGTSARYFHTLVKTKLTWKERLAKWFGVRVVEEDYDYISASRRVVVSVGFETLPNKNHYYSEDLWSKVGKQFFDGRLNKGEAVYCEIIGRTYDGAAIQSGYTYGFTEPKVYIYRISNINPQGVEIDLPYEQMVERAAQLNIEACPVFFTGTFKEFIEKYSQEEYPKDDRDVEAVVEKIFYKQLLEKDSILDKSVIEEGFCVRIDKYPKPDTFKIKSRLFLLHEGAIKDKDIVDIEEEQTA